MEVKHIMSLNPVTLGPNGTLKEAGKLMEKHNIGALPIFEKNKLKGMVTDRDLAIRAVGHGLDANKTPVAEIMSKKCITCRENDDIKDAVNLMEEQGVRRLVVTDQSGQKPVGIFSLDDIARKSKDEKLASSAFMKLNKKLRRVV